MTTQIDNTIIYHSYPIYLEDGITAKVLFHRERETGSWIVVNINHAQDQFPNMVLDRAIMLFARTIFLDTENQPEEIHDNAH